MGQSGIKVGTTEARIQSHVAQAFKEQDQDSLRGSRKQELLGSLFREPLLDDSEAVIFYFSPS